MNCSIVLLFVSTLAALAQTNLSNSLTNDVLIDSNGMRVALSDNCFGMTNIETATQTRQLDADKDLCLILHGAESVRFLRTNSFNFELKTMDGAPIPGTQTGKEMNTLPNPLATASAAIRIGSGVLSFPKITE